MSWLGPRHCLMLILHMSSTYFVPSSKLDAGDSDLRETESLPKEKLQFIRGAKSVHKCNQVVL